MFPLFSPGGHSLDRHLHPAEGMEGVPGLEGDRLANHLRADKVVPVLVNAMTFIGPSLCHDRGPDLQYGPDLILGPGLPQDEAVFAQKVHDSAEGVVLATVAMTTVAAVEGLQLQTEAAAAIGIRPVL